MTLLVHKRQELFQFLITHARFLSRFLISISLSSDGDAITLHKVSSLHISFFKTFNSKKKLKQTSSLLNYPKGLPLGLALLYMYYSLTLENILACSLLLLL